MPLVDFMTTTASTKRHPAMSGGKRGDPVTHLESVKITPPMIADNQTYTRITQGRGFEGTAKQMQLVYTESHAHTDSSSPVTQVPDIIIGDTLVIGSDNYTVEHVYTEPATTSFGATLMLLISKDKRA